MNHEYQTPYVVEIPKVHKPVEADDFAVFPRPIAGGSPEMDEPDYSIGIAQFAKNLLIEP